MKTLLIDIETYSDEDLTKSGVFRYAESDAFRILLFSYSADSAPAVCVDLAQGEEIPAEIVRAIFDPSVEKYAHNMTFELTCLGKYFGKDLNVREWYDTMAYAAYLGLPLSLSQLSEVLRLEKKKLASGTALINWFSKPNKNGERRLPQDYPEKWEAYKEYCLRDVDSEVLLAQKVIGKVDVPAWERELQIADYNINKRGVRVDLNLARNAIAFWDKCSAELTVELKNLTRLENPNSVSQLKEWLAKNGCKVDAIDKSIIREKLAGWLPTPVRRAMEIRQQLGKTSVKKYEAMIAMACADGRVRGLTQYYGTFSGRFSGKGLQLQNLPQNHLENLDLTRRMLAYDDYESMEECYTSIPDTLSQLIRTALISSEGRIFHICDFNAIEARVTAWVAGEQWVLDTFINGGDIYCVTASRMFGVPVNKKGENSELRTPGKISVLALGYGGGVSAYDSMAKNYGLSFTDEEKLRYVRMYRNANPNIVKFWSTIEKAAKTAISRGNGGAPVRFNRGCEFQMRYGFLFLKLPSGRSICYPRVKVEAGPKGDRITYERLNQTTRKWERTDTYGGKLTENLVQSIARDILGLVLLRAEKAGHEVNFHVHDEIIVDSPNKEALPEIEAIFSEEIPWAKDLPMKGAGYSGNYYYKD